MLHTEDCPNAIEYLPRLRRLVTEAGVTDPVRVLMISDSDQAYREGFLGSPTVRVDDRDVEPMATSHRDVGLSCRLYASPNGMRGMPPDEWILELLRPTTGLETRPDAVC